jgi:cytochrome oxidase assembly protein ShyY1
MLGAITHIFDLHIVTAADIAAARQYKVWQPGRASPLLGAADPQCPLPATWLLQYAELSLVHVTSGMPYMGHYLEIIGPGPAGNGKMILDGRIQGWGDPSKIDREYHLRYGVGWGVFCKSLTAGDGIYFKAQYREVLQ